MKKGGAVYGLATFVIAVTALGAIYSSDKTSIASQSPTQPRIYMVEKDSLLRFKSTETTQAEETSTETPSAQRPQPCTNHDTRPECIAQTESQPAGIEDAKSEKPVAKVTLAPTPRANPPSIEPPKVALTNSTVIPVINQSFEKTNPPPLPKLNFTIENAEICHKQQPVMLIWVFTATGNFLKRNAIRAAWGNATQYLPMKVVVVFSLAIPSSFTNIQSKLVAEQAVHGDLVQDGSFIDAYRNLTYKAQSMLRWTAAFCKDVKLLFKVDDDSFLIPMRVTKWLQEFELANSWPNNSVIGTIWPNHHAARDGKWGTTKKDWPELTYAKKACPGSGYLITGDAVPKLVDAINQVRFLWLEDMFTTGVLGEKAGVNYINNAPHHKLLYTRNEADQNRTRANPKIYLIGHLPGADEIVKYWRKVEKFTT